MAESAAECRYNLARSYMDEGRPQAAAEVLRRLIAEDPEDARYHQHLFFCHVQRGDHAGAGRVLDRFDRISTDWPPARRTS